MMRTIRITLFAAMLLSACGAPSPRPSAGSAVPATRPSAAEGAHAYAIDAARSQLRILVYRAGPLARLGHNHVIVARHLEGAVSVGADPTAVSLVLTVPVAELVVDDSSARAAAGTEFAEAVDDDARLGTRRNMLGAGVLDAERFPSITVTTLGVRPAEGAGGPPSRLPFRSTATLAIDIAGHRSVVQVPFMLEADGARLIASGTAVLRQSALGLTPFSILLGALQVQDDIRVDYRLAATVPAGTQ